MGKRSSFERVERDFYPTPPAAVAPVIPFLSGGWFWEPCAGDGQLAEAVSAATGGLAFEMDIERYTDRTEVGDARLAACPKGCEYIITNPPWTRSILHPIIENLSDQRPTWLLFDADWVHTKQATPYLPRLRKIVSVGRVKWFPGSPHTGKDNCAWHLFDVASNAPAEFYGRAA